MAKLLINNNKKVLVGSNGKAYAVGNMDALVSDTYPVNITASDGRIMKLLRTGKLVQPETPTPEVPADIVCNNGVLKARHKSGLPLGYQMVEWLKPTGSIPITGFKTKSTQEIETVFYREQRGGSYLYSSDTATSGTTNTTAYLTAGAGNWRWDGKSYSINVSAGRIITSIQNKDGVWFNGTQYGYYTDAGDFVSTNDLRLSSGENTTVRIYSMTIREGETVTLDLAPVQRISDSAYGFYDNVSGNFYTDAKSTITAGDPIPDPVEIYTDGTPEVLTISGKNLLDPATSNIVIGEYVMAGGSSAVGANNWRTDYIPIVSGKTYAFWGRKKEGNTISAYNRINWYTANKVHITPRPSITKDTPTVGTAPSNAAFVRLSSAPYNSSTAITRDTFDEYNWMFAEAAQEIPFEPYVQPQTVTDIPMLLSVGDYKDTAELISGIKTGKVGVKVFDGTEDWVAYTSSTLVIHNATSAWGAVAGVGGYCTHLTVLKAGETTFAGACRFATAFNLYEYKTAFGVAGVAGFKAKLAELYAAGTPVIVVYPLAATTKEQVTPQPLTTNEGQNIINDVACIDNPELYIIYKI